MFFFILLISCFTVDCCRFEIATSKAMQEKKKKKGKKKLQSHAIRISMFLRPNSIVDGSFVFCEFLPFPLFFQFHGHWGTCVSLASLKIYRAHTHAFIEFLVKNIFSFENVPVVRRNVTENCDEKFYFRSWYDRFYARDIP